jgi:putative FmdB family regulatory protein
MPIYKFRCSNCAHVVETIQRMSERKAPAECSECGNEEFYQVISAPMFVLKGPGWASDGYHYAKTPADDIKGYSDDRRQTILPNRPSDTPEVKTMPAAEEPKANKL